MLLCLLQTSRRCCEVERIRKMWRGVAAEQRERVLTEGDSVSSSAHACSKSLPRKQLDDLAIDPKFAVLPRTRTAWCRASLPSARDRAHPGASSAPELARSRSYTVTGLNRKRPALEVAESIASATRVRSQKVIALARPSIRKCETASGKRARASNAATMCAWLWAESGRSCTRKFSGPRYPLSRRRRHDSRIGRLKRTQLNHPVPDIIVPP